MAAVASVPSLAAALKPAVSLHTVGSAWVLAVSVFRSAQGREQGRRLGGAVHDHLQLGRGGGGVDDAPVPSGFRQPVSGVSAGLWRDYVLRCSLLVLFLLRHYRLKNSTFLALSRSSLHFAKVRVDGSNPFARAMWDEMRTETEW